MMHKAVSGWKMLESIKKNKKGILLMLISSVCVCLGQLFWKLAINDNLPMLILGFTFYGIGALIMIVAYQYGSLSVLQPMLSLNYVLSVILGYLVLNEVITLTKSIGIFIIIIGVVLIGGGDE